MQEEGKKEWIRWKETLRKEERSKKKSGKEELWKKETKTKGGKSRSKNEE